MGKRRTRLNRKDRGNLTEFTRREQMVENKKFMDACEMAGIPATPRQYVKFVQGYGAAWKAYKSQKSLG